MDKNKLLKMKRILMVHLMLLVTLITNAEKIDGVFYILDKETKQAKITSPAGNRYTPNLILDPVTGIYTIPYSVVYEGEEYVVTEIRDYAFNGCGNLKIAIPSSIKKIAEYAFEGTILNELHISDLSVYFNIDYSGPLFRGGTDLYVNGELTTNLVIPEGITEIRDGQFAGSNFESVEIPNSVTSIGKSAFSGAGIKSVTLPENITEIKEYTFYGCGKLSSIKIPSSVTHIGDESFRDCESLSSIKIPNSVTSIGIYAFFGCSSLTSIDIPTSVVDLGYATFMCSGLESVIIPNSITTIEGETFIGCHKLKNIVLPNTISSIGFAAFYDQGSLEQIHYLGTQEQWENLLNTPGLSEPEYLNSEFLEVPCHCCVEVQENNATCKEIGHKAGWYCSECGEFVVGGESIIVPHTHVDGFCSQCGEIDMDATQVTITDGNHSYFELVDDLQLEKLTYKRTLPNTHWNALYVPFEIDVNDDLLRDYNIAYINDIHSYDRDDDGVVDEMEMEAIKIKEGILNANYPYLLKAKHDGAKTINLEMDNATLFASTETMLTCSSVFMKYDVCSTYSQIEAEELNGCYAISTEGAWQPLAVGTRLNPFRLYMKMTALPGAPVKVSPLAMKRVKIKVKGEDEVTDVTFVIEKENQNKEVYDLSGRRVMSPVKNGVYVINGNKVVY